MCLGDSWLPFQLYYVARGHLNLGLGASASQPVGLMQFCLLDQDLVTTFRKVESGSWGCSTAPFFGFARSPSSLSQGEVATSSTFS